MTEKSLYAYRYLDIPFDEVCRVVVSDPATLLQPATDAAVERADEVHADLVVAIAGFDVGREVAISVGEVEQPDSHRLRVPLAWKATRQEALFPSLTGHIQITAITEDPPLVQIALHSTYRPPLSSIGAAADAMWGHHVAEAAVDRFLQEVTVSIREMASDE